MFGKKKNPVVAIHVCLKPADYEKEERDFYLPIPEGGKYSINGITDDTKIYDAEGNICSLHKWQAGFTRVFKFVRKSDAL